MLWLFYLFPFICEFLRIGHAVYIDLFFQRKLRFKAYVLIAFAKEVNQLCK